MTAALDRLWEAAGDVGRLRRRCEAGGSLEHLAGRLAAHIASIDAMLRPSAAEVVRLWAPGDETAVDEAIALADRHAEALYARMGGRP